MRKLVKLMTITTLAATTALQVTACKDDSQFESFMNDVSSSANNNTAFFGFLGTADDEIASALQASLDLFNQPQPDGKSQWQNWVDEHEKMLANEKLNLNNIYLRYYQGPYHQDKPSDPIDSFWNDKNISWQKNIFNWVYNRTTNNDQYKIPKGVPGVTEINPKKDGSDNDMFTKLPIVFIVSKGKLITAGENWLPATSSVTEQFDAIAQFVLDNLLLVN
ncbi:hypothetical protein [Spiroplasma platyhelix]|uniref:Lipoprotein n=1 Tax=Spiroplasma platyhelix PALS-1 TaxID=1276218 RepID=A0A846U8Y9_9MOLU|nr:hypothetical protein [Spiroplasma platyhelix]MBE4703970.1 hypothetical protein [Spiroplasma platyhelix PALS-1]NKE38343.1 hypothetical protein [Spiroplasma platyhelix PALS-1]UJB29228.1 hypothetical protein SPLAT_v1c04640 [Spiroplasma platyhelix PALS-1]